MGGAYSQVRVDPNTGVEHPGCYLGDGTRLPSHINSQDACEAYHRDMGTSGWWGYSMDKTSPYNTIFECRDNNGKIVMEVGLNDEGKCMAALGELVGGGSWAVKFNGAEIRSRRADGRKEITEVPMPQSRPVPANTPEPVPMPQSRPVPANTPAPSVEISNLQAKPAPTPEVAAVVPVAPVENAEQIKFRDEGLARNKKYIDVILEVLNSYNNRALLEKDNGRYADLHVDGLLRDLTSARSLYTRDQSYINTKYKEASTK